MGMALQVESLTKRFGDYTALDGVSLGVEEGSVYGFLGPNGAGKTTTLRILTGLAHADSGSVRIFGEAPGSAAARTASGFLPDVPGFYPWMRAEEFLRFAGGLFGLGSDVLDERVPMLLSLAGLDGVKSKVGGFSRGMRQRLGIAQALVNAPRLLMLDEPTSALDPLGRKEVLDMIESLRGRTTVFFSTHILADVERVCDTVAILDRGHVVVQSPIEALKAKYSAHRIELQVDSRVDELAEKIGREPWTLSVERLGADVLTVSVKDLPAAQLALPGIVAGLGIALVRLEGGEVSLEDVFVQLVGGEHSARVSAIPA